MDKIRLLLFSTMGFGFIFLGIGLYFALKSEQPATPQFQPTIQATQMTANTPVKLTPKRTTPSGNILRDGQNGLYYRNPSNTLEIGVAYKYMNNNRVYVYDGQFLRPVASEKAFTDFYSCSTGTEIIQCAPVYEMPRNNQIPIGSTLE